MSYFPMMIELAGRDALVVGGGETGTRKVEILHEFGARVTLIAPSATDTAASLAAKYEPREFKDSDILNEQNVPAETENTDFASPGKIRDPADERYALIVAATDDMEINRRISRLASAEKIPVNVVDQPDLCTFIFPAIVKDKEVVVSVSSGGQSPYVAQYIKALIKKIIPPGIGDINERMGEIRRRAQREITDKNERRAYLKRKLIEMLL